VRLGVIWIGFEGAQIACHSLVRPAQGQEGIAKTAVRLGEIRADRQRLSDEINGDFIIANLMREDTKQMQGDGLVASIRKIS